MPTIDIRRYLAKAPAGKTDQQPAGENVLAFLNKDISLFGNGLPDKKKEAFYLELGSLLKAGISLKSSMELVIEDQKKETDKNLFLGIQRAVLGGDALSDSLRKTGKFSLYEIFSLQIGEESGKQAEVLQDLAKFYQNKIKQRRKIVSALTYPCIVMTASLGAVFIMLKFVVPMFAEVFRRFGGHLPWITGKIMGMSKMMEDNFYKGFIAMALMGVAILTLRKRQQFKKVVSSLVLRTPVVGELVQKIYLARFCNSMRLLINAHLPLLKALALIRQMIDYYPIEDSLRIIEDEVMKGSTLSQSMRRFKIFPSKMIQLIKVGEETNQLDFFFGKIADQYMEEVEYKTTNLSSVMQPLIIVFLGLMVGIILISMYLPLFQMSNSIQ